MIQVRKAVLQTRMALDVLIAEPGRPCAIITENVVSTFQIMTKIQWDYLLDMSHQTGALTYPPLSPNGIGYISGQDVD